MKSPSFLHFYLLNLATQPLSHLRGSRPQKSLVSRIDFKLLSLALQVCPWAKSADSLPAPTFPSPAPIHHRPPQAPSCFLPHFCAFAYTISPAQATSTHLPTLSFASWPVLQSHLLQGIWLQTRHVQAGKRNLGNNRSDLLA